MNKLTLMAMVVTLILAFTAGAVTAQDNAKEEKAPPSYKVSPEVYKLLGENDQFWVILRTSKPGQRDAWHSHTDFVGYWLSDCTTRAHWPDGKSTEAVKKRGQVDLNPAVASHWTENTGKTDCEDLFVERK